MQANEHLPKKRSAYIPQLDGLRAIAILLVLIGHWTEFRPLIIFNPRCGVLLFFMLSGYLITGILLDRKQQALHSSKLKRHVWQGFFARRVLRIFPLFFGVLLVLYLLDFTDVRRHIWWHASYLSNFVMALENRWPLNTAHFWSLAIEEQFYLVWPVMILLLPNRLFKPLLFCFLIGAPLFRLMIMLAGGATVAMWVLPFSVVDSLGLGALFAFLQRSSWMSDKKLLRLSLLMTCAGLFLLALLECLYYTSVDKIFLEQLSIIALDSTIILTFSAPLVYSALQHSGWSNKLLTWPPLTYLGKISYGIYIFHLPITEFSWRIFHFFDASQVYDSLSKAEITAIWTVLTLALSSFSWHFFESKVNNLKSHFPYLPAKKAVQSSPIIPV